MLQTKPEIRDHIKEILKENLLNLELWSKSICNILLTHSRVAEASTIAIYHARPFEPNLEAFIKVHGKKCVFPRVDTDRNEIDYFRAKDFSRGFAGIFEPKGSLLYDSWQPTDLILVPGLAFSLEGDRVGSGKGFFDRFLERIPSEIPKWGICFDLQILKEIPKEGHDIAVDALVTPSGIQVICH